MQCACAILSSVTTAALLHFSTLPHKRHYFRVKKKITEHKMYVLISATNFVCNISLSKIIDQEMIKSASFYCQILMKLAFSRQIFEK
jgi:hypothetical protein